MDGVLCPVVVGRSVELAALAGLVADAADGRGGLAVLVGEAGVGKSRLAREAAALAAGRGVLVLSGRAVPAGSPLPFRPLSEALLVASRGKRPPDSPELAGFGGQLARLVPDWGTGDTTGGADNSPVLVGEAVVRLLRVLGGAAGCLLVLEDLHWADPETLAVVDYLADTLAAERVLCLATTRSAGPSHVADVLDRLRSRRVGTVLPLAPLSDGECADMVRACLSGAEEVGPCRAGLRRRAQRRAAVPDRGAAGRAGHLGSADRGRTGGGGPSRHPPRRYPPASRRRCAPGFRRSTPTPGMCSPPRPCWAGGSTGTCFPVSPRSTARRWSGRCVEPSTPSSSPWTASGSGSATPSPVRPCSPSCCHRSGPSCPGGRSSRCSGRTRVCPVRGASWRPSSPKAPETGSRPRRSRPRALTAPWPVEHWPAPS